MSVTIIQASCIGIILLEPKTGTDLVVGALILFAWIVLFVRRLLHENQG